jgi:tetratricopeptide (TPR) repeat protein
VKVSPPAPGVRWPPDWRLHGALVLVLACTFAVYAPVLRHGFVEWDDPTYVTENEHVRSGLNANGIAWAFTSTGTSNWHPLTWLSHMLDVQLYGVEPWGHHLTSLLLHLVNTVLLFVALRRLSGAAWRSLAVTALFALHPLHVESVAWVAERKDVLSTSFWFAAVWAYARFLERRTPARYAVVALFFGLGLLAKPMLVTLPLTLLIVDYWPLRRGGRGGWAAVQPLVVEKLPLFAMSLASSIMTWLAQRTYGAVVDTPLGVRIATAALGYWAYLEKMLWPVHLAAFYPYDLQPSLAESAAKAAALVLLTIAMAWLGRRRAYLRAGWLWYLVTLLPVIGLVRVGQQSMADRYTYVPLVGVFMMIVWGAADLVARVRATRVARAGLAVGALLLGATLAIAARRQVDVWKDGVTLWEHAIAVGGNSTISQNNLGVAFEHSGRLEEGATHYSEAIRLEPRHAKAHCNLGNARFAQGRFAEAIPAYENALQLDPSYELARRNLAKCHFNLANSEWRQGHVDVAVREYQESIRWTPDDAAYHRALGMALLQQGHGDEGIAAIQRALEIDPGSASTHDVLAIALFQRGDYEAAAREVQACRAAGGVPTAWVVEELERRREGKR